MHGNTETSLRQDVIDNLMSKLQSKGIYDYPTNYFNTIILDTYGTRSEKKIIISTCVAWMTAGSPDGPADVEYRGFSNVIGCCPALVKFSS